MVVVGNVGNVGNVAIEMEIEVETVVVVVVANWIEQDPLEISLA